MDDGNVSGHGGLGDQRPNAPFGIDAHALSQHVDQGRVLLGAHEHIDVRELPL